MKNENYQKEYKQKYLREKKIVTFPLTNIFYEQLKKSAILSDTSANTQAKNIVTSHLTKTDLPKELSVEKKKYIQEYMRISRSIANNVNQIAYHSNIGEQIDINILLQSLQNYEEQFKKFISKV